MKIQQQLKKLADRSPFKPFSIRLADGKTYVFKEQRNFGAPRDLHSIVFFGPKSWALIDPIHIVEVTAT